MFESSFVLAETVPSCRVEKGGRTPEYSHGASLLLRCSRGVFPWRFPRQNQLRQRLEDREFVSDCDMAWPCESIQVFKSLTHNKGEFSSFPASFFFFSSRGIISGAFFSW